MNWQTSLNQLFMESIGWTLVHSFWQLFVLAVMLFVALRILKNASANLRYLFCVAVLFLTILIPAFTFLSFSSNLAVKNEIPLARFNENNTDYQIKTIEKDSLIQPNTNVYELSEIVKNKAPQNDIGNLPIHIEKLVADSLPYIVWFWLGGVMIFSIRLGGGFWQTFRLKTLTTSPINDEWQKRFNYLYEKIGIRRAVSVLQSEIAESPMVIGWLKPFVIVPSSVLLGLKPHELETIIAHELIHIRRHDYLINILQSLIEVILFFHPATWWISAQIRRERENACDDEVLKIFGNEYLRYANALANLENLRIQTNNLTPSNGVAANGGNLMKRIQRILKTQSPKNLRRQSLWAMIPAFLIVSTILVTVFLINRQTVVGEEVSLGKTNTKKVAVGLYAASTVIPSENPPEEDLKTMRLVIEKLKQHKIPTTGFLMGVKVNARTENIPEDQKQIISLWREANFEIGLLGYKHPQSFNATIEEYQAALKSRDDKLNPYFEKQVEIFKNAKKIDLKTASPEEKKNYFEELKQRKTPLDEMRKVIDRVEKEWLKENNLTSVRYTFGTHDWIYSYTYDVARKENNRELMNRIKTAYIEYLSKSLDYYEQYSQYLFERDIPQTLPLTPSHLLADSIGELAAMFQKHGYQFVSLDEAMKDEAYQSGRIFASGTGSSWFDSVDLDRRMVLLENPNANSEQSKRFPDKPNVDSDVLKIWEENQPINPKMVK